MATTETQALPGNVMTRTRLINHPNVDGVAAGQDSTLPIQLDHAYRQLLLHVTESGVAATLAVMKAMFEEAKLSINGTEIANFNVSDYLTYLESEGYDFTDGILPINFDRIGARTSAGEDATIFGTLGLTQATLTLSVASSATTPKISKVQAVVVPNRKPSYMVTFKTRTLSSLDAGDNDVTQIDMGTAKNSSGDLVELMFMSADINKMSIYYKSRAILEDATRDVIHGQLKNQAVVKAPQTGVTHVDFTQSGRIGDVLPAEGGSLYMKMDMASAQSVRVLDVRFRNISSFVS